MALVPSKEKATFLPQLTETERLNGASSDSLVSLEEYMY